MTEPRARAGKHSQTPNFPKELTHFLRGYGAPTHPNILDPHPDSRQYLTNPNDKAKSFAEPFPETVRVLDEIVTDFLIETCHEAVAHASLLGRQKLTANDFRFAMRKDKMMLGRAQTMMATNARDAALRKVPTEAEKGKDRLKADELQGLAGMAGEQGTNKGVGRGKGKRRKRKAVSQEPDAGSPRENEDDDNRSERSKSAKRTRSDVG